MIAPVFGSGVNKDVGDVCGCSNDDDDGDDDDDDDDACTDAFDAFDASYPICKMCSVQVKCIVVLSRLGLTNFRTGATIGGCQSGGHNIYTIIVP